MAKEAVISSARIGQPTIVPISDLSPYTSLTIRARVIFKAPIKMYNNSKGDGSFFTFNLTDQSGEIKGSCFNQQVVKFFEMLKVSKVYLFSKYNVKDAHPQYNNLDHEYEISLNDKSIVELCTTDIEDIPKIDYNFIGIEDIANKPESSLVDIIGICKRVADILNVRQRSINRELVKREITLVDQSITEISVTIWGKQAADFADKSQPVIAVKGAKVSNFNGKSVSLLWSSVFEINPEIKEAHVLRSWYDNVGHNQKTTSLTIIGGIGGGGNTHLKNLKEANSFVMDSLDIEQIFIADVSVKSIRENIYKACGQDGCFKKIWDQLNWTYFCKKCNKVMYNFKYRMVLDVIFCDASDEIRATCFQAVSEIILGESAEELGRLKTFDPEKLKITIQNALNKSYSIKLRTKLEDYNFCTYRKNTAISIGQF